jgi:hypothetical protein
VRAAGGARHFERGIPEILRHFGDGVFGAVLAEQIDHGEKLLTFRQTFSLGDLIVGIVASEVRALVWSLDKTSSGWKS